MDLGLDLDNVVDPTELFTDNDPVSEKDAGIKDKEGKKEEQSVEEINVNELFTTPEKVDGPDKPSEGKDAKTEKADTSSPETTIFSSIAAALKEQGVFPDLDDSDVQGISDIDGFITAFNKQVESALDERQKRIDHAMQYGIEVSDIQRFENAISYLNNINESTIEAETPEGEELRKQLIYQDFLNRGFTQERASRELEKSLKAGTDIEDARDALAANKQYFIGNYNQRIEQAKKEYEAEEARQKKTIEDLKKKILDEEKPFEGINIDKATRAKIYESTLKPKIKTDSGEYLTELQHFQQTNPTEFLHKLGILFTLTDGFKNIDKLVSGTKQVIKKQAVQELEQKIQNTRRNSDGTLDFMSGTAQKDKESYHGLQIGW